MTNPVTTKPFLQPAKAAAMCTVSRAEIHPSPPIKPFLLAQNLSSKRVAPTDNMQPKFQDEYTRHQWLKGEHLHVYSLEVCYTCYVDTTTSDDVTASKPINSVFIYNLICSKSLTFWDGRVEA